MSSPRERWRTEWLPATMYDAVAERERVARAVGRLIYGVDTAAFYRELARLGAEPPGTAILDVPCGGGIAFRGLRPEQRLRYAAVDLSPLMLKRARAVARRRGIDWIDYIEADVEALPFDSASFDLCVTYTGLQCFARPAAALAEMARVLRPGGSVRGTVAVTGTGWRQDIFIRLMQRAKLFGPCGTPADVEAWLAAAGLGEVTIRQDAAVVYFSARRAEPRGGRMSASDATGVAPD